MSSRFGTGYGKSSNAHKRRKSFTLEVEGKLIYDIWVASLFTFADNILIFLPGGLHRDDELHRRCPSRYENLFSLAGFRLAKRLTVSSL